jgi:Flp pilus assembly protein TadB
MPAGDDDLDEQLRDARDIHRREHEAAERAHRELHGAEKQARDAAVASMEKRLESMNEFRDQLREQATTFQQVKTAEAAHDAIDKRLDEMRERIVAIEKGDVKQEGRSLGQGAVVAIIVGAVAFVGSILGIVIVVVNILTGS